MFSYMYHTLLCSHSPNDVPPEIQRNVSIAAVRGAVRPSKCTISMLGTLYICRNAVNLTIETLTDLICFNYFFSYGVYYASIYTRNDLCDTFHFTHFDSLQ